MRSDFSTNSRSNQPPHAWQTTETDDETFKSTSTNFCLWGRTTRSLEIPVEFASKSESGDLWSVRQFTRKSLHFGNLCFRNSYLLKMSSLNETRRKRPARWTCKRKVAHWTGGGMAERTKSPSDIVLYYSGFCRGGGFCPTVIPRGFCLGGILSRKDYVLDSWNGGIGYIAYTQGSPPCMW